MSRKRCIIATLEEDERSKSFTSKRLTNDRRGHRPPFPDDPKKAMTLLDKWVRDKVVTLPEAHRVPSCKDQEEMYCPYHWNRGYTPSSDAFCSKRSLMRNTDQVECPFKRADHLASMCRFRGASEYPTSLEVPSPCSRSRFLTRRRSFKRILDDC